MFAVSNLIVGIARVLEMFLQMYMFIVLGRVIISWVNADPYNPIVRFLNRATEPLFRRIRRWFPILANMGGLDLTPLVVLGIVYLLQAAVIMNLYDLAAYLKANG